MTSRRRSREARTGLDLIEESFHLLRRMPLSVLGRYYAGSLPFVVGFLYFWADMSRSAFAAYTAASAALLMALLYLWMKAWQAVFCGHVRAIVSHGPSPRRSIGEMFRLCAVQAALQPLCLVALPVALLITLPFGWVYAFFHNISVLGDGSTSSLKSICSRAYRQAALSPGQNHIAICCLFAFGFLVQLNVIMGLSMLPHLVKMFTGMESEFTMAGGHLFNSTFFAITFGLTYLLMNPFIKTFYVLRCFYGESMSDGEDLRIDLRRMKAARGIAAASVCLMIGLQVLTGDMAAHASPQPSGSAPTVTAAELDHSLNDTLSRREYAWRLPRQKAAGQEGPLDAFMRGVSEVLREWFDTGMTWIKDALEWIFRKLFGIGRSGGYSFGPLDISPSALYVVLACMVVIGLVIVLIKMKSRPANEPQEGIQVVKPPDLADDSLTADKLPAEGWSALARKLLNDGEYRLGLRALYLATLAHLALRGAITIARHKSDRDYNRELSRRAASNVELISVFDSNMRVFEGIWYGMHEIQPGTISSFKTNHERIVTLADRQ